MRYNSLMMISVLPSLESKTDWLNFFRREHPYCLIETPSSLVDFQSTYLQLTCFTGQQEDAVRYTLGSRSSLEPAWQLIKGCGWSLTCVVNGLETLNFNTSVRDSAAFKLPSDLSVRKSFAREPRLQPFLNIGAADSISPVQLALRIRNQQFDQLTAIEKRPLPSLHSLIVSLSTESRRWQIERQQNRVQASLDHQPMFTLMLLDTLAKRHCSNVDIRL